MLNYYKYLPVSEKDEAWGLYIVNAGFTHIKPNQLYPADEHPSHHHFSWEKGRILNEFQMVYITAGEGVFQSSGTAEIKVKAGSIILLFPHEWHRYKPSPNTGWDEYWVGFKGEIVNNIFKKDFFPKKRPIAFIGFKESLVSMLEEIMEESRNERPGYQPHMAGIVMHLLGKISSLQKQQEIEQEDSVQVTIGKAQLILRRKVDECVTIKEVAQELQVSYAWFRKMFKLYTGLPPQQYLIQLKIERAKTLLNEQALSIKQIAHKLNFEYPVNFSKLFKEKVGLSPERYRQKFIMINN